MLSNLVVENYALISKLEIDFRKGLTIITGETGAGKSILLGALSLILGKRADTTVLLDKERKCIVEGTFELTGYGLQDFFTTQGIDYADQSIIRREILTNGKSRAFVNDTPVNLELLTDLSSKLIDIHSQHQNLNLSDNSFQMKVLDSFANNSGLLHKYSVQFELFRMVQKKYRELSENAAKIKADLDYLQFQFNQLQDAKLTAGEQEELELELEKLTHAEEIKTALQHAVSILQGEGTPVVQQLKDAHTAIFKIIKFLHGREDLDSRLESAYIEIKDVAHELDMLNDQLVYDPERLAQVNDRLTLLYDLEKKHRVSSLAELIALRSDFEQKIAGIHAIDGNLTGLEREMSTSLEAARKSAAMLSASRRKAVPEFEKKVAEMLREVGIPAALFIIELGRVEELAAQGEDKIRFLFSANKNLQPQDIARVASGGEISRLMLCIKSLMLDAMGLPTIIFDEIDTGVSGDIAERVGNIIHRMADRMQIINITHLPQVASKGRNHFLVYKTDDGNSTLTRIKLLTDQERHVEIAKMLSGEEITPAALENARALLGK